MVVITRERSVSSSQISRNFHGTQETIHQCRRTHAPGQQAVGFYGYALPEIHRVGNETRTACFLNCGKTKDTGDRALAIKGDDPLKSWFCHQYGCGKSGNLVSLCDLMKPGPVAGGRPRGERFKEIAADLQAMASGAVKQVLTPGQTVPPKPMPEPKKVNVILKESDNERHAAW